MEKQNGMKYDFYITGPIGEEYDWWTDRRGTTSEMVKNFLNQNKGKELTIAVSSLGGQLDEGITIAELIAAHGNCNMVIVGMTASAATILCMKAKSVKIARGSLMLIHNSSQSINSLGTANKKKLEAYIETLKATKQNLDTYDKAIADIYSYRNHKSIEENCSMMDKEKWLTAQEALDFGLVDEILDEAKAEEEANAVQNVYANYYGIEERFHLPSLPAVAHATPKVPRGIMAKIQRLFADNKTNNNNNVIMNKKFIKVNALLKVEGFNESDSGIVVTAEQMQVIEDTLAALQGKAENLGNIESQLAKAKADLQTAETAKATAETNLQNLQTEFDNFKKEAGDSSVKLPGNQLGKMEMHTSSDMFNTIKDLL